METFNKIGAASTTHLGLETLYNLLEEHPTFPVEDLLSRTSEPFRNYIDKGLHKVCPRPVLLCSHVDCAHADDTVPHPPPSPPRHISSHAYVCPV